MHHTIKVIHCARLSIDLYTFANVMGKLFTRPSFQRRGMTLPSLRPIVAQISRLCVLYDPIHSCGGCFKPVRPLANQANLALSQREAVYIAFKEERSESVGLHTGKQDRQVQVSRVLFLVCHDRTIEEKTYHYLRYLHLGILLQFKKCFMQAYIICVQLTILTVFSFLCCSHMVTYLDISNF